jgi:hypothetical protein
MSREDEYLELAVKVAEINPAAADYMLAEPVNLCSDLRSAFVWGCTPQGHRFWSGIEAELASREANP